MTAFCRSRSSMLFAILLCVAVSSLAAPDDRRDLLAYVAATKRGSGGGGGAEMPDCRAMAYRSECLGSSKWCRWCRSDALDDMCFGFGEAWRLPIQVFSCEEPTS